MALPLLPFLLIVGCDGAPLEALRPDSGVPVVRDAATDAETSGSCLARGGALEVLRTLDNNVVTDHGGLVTLDWGTSGQIAVASTDGAIKLWTVEGTSSGGLRAGAPVYDAAFGAGSPVVGALAYAPGALWAGDETGRVVRYRTADLEPAFEATVTGAVRSLDASGERWAALADGLTVDGAEVSAPIDAPRAVALDDSGAWVVGAHGGQAALARSGGAPETVALEGALVAVAVEEGRLLAAGDGGVAIHDSEGTRVLGTEPSRGVAFAPGGDAVLVAEPGRVVARGLDGAELASVAVEGLIDVRAQPGRDHVVAIDDTGGIFVLGCR